MTEATATTPAGAAEKSNASPQREFVSLWIDNQLLGVPVEVVQEVLNPQVVARTPRARPEIAGLLNLRGQIVTAVNLRRRLGFPESEDDTRLKNVIVRHGDESFSLLVDQVEDVIGVASDGIGPVPPTLDSRWKSVTTGVCQLEDRLLIILNVEAALNLGGSE